MDELNLRQQAIEMIKIDEQEKQVLSAFIERGVKATKIQGEKEFYEYQKPTDLFDAKKARLAVFGENSTSEERNKINMLKRNEKLFNKIFEEGG